MTDPHIPAFPALLAGELVGDACECVVCRSDCAHIIPCSRPVDGPGLIACRGQ